MFAMTLLLPRVLAPPAPHLPMPLPPLLIPAEERLRAIADAQMETEIAAARAHAEAVKNHGRSG